MVLLSLQCNASQTPNLLRPRSQSCTLFVEIVVPLVHADDPRTRAGQVIQYRFGHLKSNSKLLQAGSRSPTKVVQRPVRNGFAHPFFEIVPDTRHSLAKSTRTCLPVPPCGNELVAPIVINLRLDELASALVV